MPSTDFLEDAVRVGKRYRVSGPLTLLFRLYYARKIRATVPETFAALEHEARRRVAAVPA